MPRRPRTPSRSPIRRARPRLAPRSPEGPPTPELLRQRRQHRQPPRARASNCGERWVDGPQAV
eukprot:7525769-Alexandrium_andersonii.AAC.1